MKGRLPVLRSGNPNTVARNLLLNRSFADCILGLPYEMIFLETLW
ncbi:hypothetical protein [Zobellia nedashkovskayae]|nr:hypothetical protein [Zobellia nedashkovskayae]